MNHVGHDSKDQIALVNLYFSMMVDGPVEAKEVLANMMMKDFSGNLILLGRF